MLKYFALGALLVGLATAAQAQSGGWQTEFAERPADWGGDIHYAVLRQADQGVLQVGCVRNRIERVLVTFAQPGGAPVNLPAEPQVFYAFDGGALEPGAWPLFEPGAIEVPRGAESARITRQIAQSSRLVVQASTSDGGTVSADFDLSGSDAVIPPMLQSCGMQ